MEVVDKTLPNMSTAFGQMYSIIGSPPISITPEQLIRGLLFQAPFAIRLGPVGGVLGLCLMLAGLPVLEWMHDIGVT